MSLKIVKDQSGSNKQGPLFADVLINITQVHTGHFKEFDSDDRLYRDRMIKEILSYCRVEWNRIHPNHEQVMNEARQFSAEFSNVLDWTHINRFHFLGMLEKESTPDKYPNFYSVIYGIAFNYRPYCGWHC